MLVHKLPFIARADEHHGCLLPEFGWRAIHHAGEVAVESCDPDIAEYLDGQLAHVHLRAFQHAGHCPLACRVTLLQCLSSGAVQPSFTFRDGTEQTTFVCGFLGCDPRQFDPLLSTLPPMLCVRNCADPLAQLVELALAEARTPGAASVRERLSESMFLETVRQYLAEADELSRLGVRDEVVGRALALMHEHPESPWTLVSLAESVGASRTVLAERFSKVMGKPPMQYLARWRLQIAARLLTDSTATVSATASAVGYSSEAAFSRAFKRTMGVPPGLWRQNSDRPDVKIQVTTAGDRAGR